MDPLSYLRQHLAGRIRLIRIDRYGEGEGGIAGMAEALTLPQGTWRNFEDGASMPAEILLLVIDLTDVDPHWLLTGDGERYSRTGFSRDFDPDHR